MLVKNFGKDDCDIEVNVKEGQEWLENTIKLSLYAFTCFWISIAQNLGR
jgi:hypothetical protein